MSTLTLKCQRCNEVKPVSQFGEDDDYRYCDDCEAISFAEYTQREVERIASRAAELGCTIKLVKLIEALEGKIERLENELYSYMDDPRRM